MLNRKHDRIFVMLEGTNGINGSCDMEIINGKGRLFCYAGGINIPVQLHFLADDGSKITVGQLEKKGTNAVFETAFSPENIFESGKTIEEIFSAEIKTEDGQTILSGSFPKQTKPAEKPTCKKQPPETVEHSKTETFRKFIKTFRQELDDLDNIKVEVPEKPTTENKADLLFENGISPKIYDSVKWVKADLRDAYFIENAVSILEKPFVKNSARKGRHILVGKDENGYYIGVTGRITQQNSAVLNGFERFISADKDGKTGYWIIKI